VYSDILQRTFSPIVSDAWKKRNETAAHLHYGLVRSGTVFKIEVVVVDSRLDEIGAVILLAIEADNRRHLPGLGFRIQDSGFTV